MASAFGVWKAVFGLGAAGSLVGCGSYTSDYVPPNDGRARAVWHDDRVVASLPTDSGVSAACTGAVEDVKSEPRRYAVYYGGSPGVVIWRPWIVVHHHHHHGPTFAGAGRIGTPGGGTVTRSPARPSAGGSKGGSSSGGVSSLGSGGGSSGGGGDIGKAAVLLAVAALLTLPIITLGLGLGRPEPSGKVATAIDEVNAYNDLARLPGSPCAAPEAEEAP